MFVGLVLNFVLIWAYYRESLSGFRGREADADSSEYPLQSTRLTPLARRRAASSKKSDTIREDIGPKLKELSKKGSLTVR